MDTETANLLFQLLYVLRQDHVVAAKITAVRCGGTLLLIPYPSMIGSADAGVVGGGGLWAAISSLGMLGLGQDIS